MKKTVHQFLCILLVLLMLLPCISSCRKTEKEPKVTTAQVTQSTPNTPDTPDTPDTPPSVTQFTVDMLSEMKIIYAHGAPEELTEKADELRGLIQDKYGVEVLVASDYLRKGSAIYSEATHEILIGETNRTADDEYYAKIRYEDYGYTTMGGKIIIGGGNLQGTLKALSDFSFNIVLQKKGGDLLFFSPDLAMEYNYNYSASEILLNGTSYLNYRIVYPENGTQFEQQLAIHIASNLEKLTGYRLDIVTDATAYADGYEILIGKTNRNNAIYATATGDMEGCLASNGKLIAAYGASALGNSVAATALVDRIQAGVSQNSTTVELQIASSEVIRKTETIASMTYNVYAGNVSEERSAQVFEMLWRYMPDVFCLQEASPSWMMKFDRDFIQYYDRVGEGATGGTTGNHVAIFYAKERFELLKTETKWLSETPDEVSQVTGCNWIRNFTYALLKDRITGETTCFVNTHLDFGDARYQQVKILIQLLLEYGLEDYPIVLTGDMNCQYGSKEIQYMLRVGLSSANHIAQVVNGLPEIDYIMVTGDCIQVSYAQVCGETIQGALPSDHPATYAEYTVKIPESGIDHDFREPLPIFPNDWVEIERDENDHLGDLNRVPNVNVPVPDEIPEEEIPEEELPVFEEGLTIEKDEAGAEFGGLNRVY